MRNKEEYLAELSFHLGMAQQAVHGSTQAGSYLHRRVRLGEQIHGVAAPTQAWRAQTMVNQGGSSASALRVLVFLDAAILLVVVLLLLAVMKVVFLLSR